MRFGTFVFPFSLNVNDDRQVIDNTLREVELAEEIGLDAVWLTEHHFDGAVAYADPVVFAAAVAMKTRKVRIGFAVVEMALHHPVRLAAQTALLDNLSQGQPHRWHGSRVGLQRVRVHRFRRADERGPRDAVRGRGTAGQGVDLRRCAP